MIDAGFFSKLLVNRVRRPYAVIGAGWQGGAADDPRGPGPWNQPNGRFGRNFNMGQLANWMRNNYLRPGIWCRPLIAEDSMPQDWRLARDSNVLDPSLPEVRAHARSMMAQFARWGYDLVQVDDSTHDISGRTGEEMRHGFTSDGWSFADRSRTTAEIIRDFYWDIRESAGNKVVIEGCDTLGHLAAGIFEVQRASGDSGGMDRIDMGVNGLAFRAPQQGVFFSVDGGCAGESANNSVSWGKNKQWLCLLSRGGGVALTSFSKASLNTEKAGVLRQALMDASRWPPAAEPLDWLDNSVPSQWRLNGAGASFNW
jgi:alpha-galactosidase